MMYVITPVVGIPRLTVTHFCTPPINLVFGWKTRVSLTVEFPDNVTPQDVMESKSERKVYAIVMNGVTAHMAKRVEVGFVIICEIPFLRFKVLILLHQSSYITNYIAIQVLHRGLHTL